jgi:O-antigen/teichoic acid export membrane protein
MKRFGRLMGLASVGSADIVGSAIAAIFWFYLASLIDPEKYGEISYFLGIAGVSSYIATIGTQNTITVYIAKDVKLQSTLYFISLIVGIISSIVLALIFYRVDASLLLLAYIVNALALGDLLGRKLFQNYLKYTLIQKGLTLILGIGSYFAFGPDGILYALALSYVSFSVIVYRGLKRSNLDFKLLKSKFGFIFNNYLVYVTGGFTGQIDKLLIAPLFGFAVLGNYSLALQATSVLMILSRAAFKYTLPQDAEGHKNYLIKKLTFLSAIVLAITGIIVAPMIIPLAFPKYSGATQAIQIMSLDVIPSTLSMIYWSKFLGMERSRYVLISTIIGFVVSVVGIVTLGYLYGIVGLAASLVLSSASQAGYLSYVSYSLKR